MTKATLSSLCFLFVFNLAAFAQAPAPAPERTPQVEDAVAEAVRREAWKVELRRKLIDADAARKKGDHVAAAKLYEDCLALIKKIGTGVEPEQKQVMAGFVATRLTLAEQAQRRFDFVEADAQLARILKEAPKNEAALAARRANDQIRLENEGKMPDDATIAMMPEAQVQKVNDCGGVAAQRQVSV